MRTFKALFNRMRDEYNDEEKGDILIPFNPFKKYKLPTIPVTSKRALSISQIKAIRDVFLIRKRDLLARDVFMLSFYLLGMNTVDMYNLTKAQKGRIEYNRIKTQSRRQDEAFISIKIPPEAEALIKKYRDPARDRLFNFYRRYISSKEFNRNINIGLKNIGKKAEVKAEGLTFYAARHSWATIARNDCGISKDDIHEALNHSDPSMRVTDIYIKKDWSVIDRANRKVLDVIKNNE